MARLSYAAAALIFAFAAQGQKIPDPSEGNVNGLQGIFFLPEAVVDGESRLVEPAGCTVHLLPTGIDKPLTYDCAKWFAPPPDRYMVWLEQGNRVSDKTVLIYPGSKFGNNGLVATMPLEPAGFAAMSTETVVGAGQTARFLSLEPSATGFDRRLRAAEIRSAIRLPAGRAIAGIFDAEGNAVALSRPFAMKAGQTVVVTPKPPSHGTDLMAVFGKHQANSQDRAKRNTSVSVRIADAVHAPDVICETDGRIIAVWYSLSGGEATLTAASDLFRSPEQRTALSAGRVTTVRQELSSK